MLNKSVIAPDPGALWQVRARCRERHVEALAEGTPGPRWYTPAQGRQPGQPRPATFPAAGGAVRLAAPPNSAQPTTHFLPNNAGIITPPSLYPFHRGEIEGRSGAARPPSPAASGRLLNSGNAATPLVFTAQRQRQPGQPRLAALTALSSGRGALPHSNSAQP